MARDNQGSSASETRISVDMNAADPDKAVTRTSPKDIAAQVRDDADTDRPRSKAEKELFKRMGRLERNLTRQFDQQRADDEARHQRELSELRDQVKKVQVDRTGDDAADAAHDTAINALKDKLMAAHEKGDSQAAADITLQISKLDAQFWAKKAAAAGVTTRETTTAATDTGKGAHPTNQQQRAGKGPTAAGSRFITANEEWWDDPAFEAEQSTANTIYLRLVEKEGFDPKSDETFKEIAKQVKAKFPKLDIRAGRDDAGPGDDDDDDDEARQQERQTQGQGRQRRAAAANVQDRGPANERNRGATRTLTAEERKTMEACRLDPNNDRDVVQFLREAAAMEASA
jgi:hypothetical protein